MGASFLCGIPFPYITIRTNRLEASRAAPGGVCAGRSDNRLTVLLCAAPCFPPQGTLDPATGATTLLFDADFLAQVRLCEGVSGCPCTWQQPDDRHPFAGTRLARKNPPGCLFAQR
jgi:hypothetical protein